MSCFVHTLIIRQIYKQERQTKVPFVCLFLLSLNLLAIKGKTQVWILNKSRRMLLIVLLFYELTRTSLKFGDKIQSKYWYQAQILSVING